VDTDLTIRQMTHNDENQVKHIIDLSFPKFHRFFASHNLNEEGHVLVSEVQGTVVGFAKLIDFRIGGRKYGCILWIAVHPSFRRKGFAAKLTSNAIHYLKQHGAIAVYASTQKRNVAALFVLRRQGFRRMVFFDLWHIFSWRVFRFYSAIWFAPGEIVLMHD
jgi:ribosomal protein S18 acetylase RimI-like enzyme